MSGPAIPKSVARRLVSASRAEQRAAERLQAAQAQLAYELAVAQGDGYSVRMLADVIERSPSTTHRLMQADDA